MTRSSRKQYSGKPSRKKAPRSGEPIDKRDDSHQKWLNRDKEDKARVAMLTSSKAVPHRATAHV